MQRAGSAFGRGVSTGRIVAPVLFSSFALLSLSIINQEIFVPAVADKLVCQKDDPHGLGPMVVRGRYEPNGIHIEGKKPVAPTTK